MTNLLNSNDEGSILDASGIEPLLYLYPTEIKVNVPQISQIYTDVIL